MKVLVFSAASWLRRPGRTAGTLAAALSLAAAVMTAGTPGASAAAGPPAPTARQPAAGMRPACAPARPGFARCYALWGPQATVNRAIAAGVTGAAARPKGWGPGTWNPPTSFRSAATRTRPSRSRSPTTPPTWLTSWPSTASSTVYPACTSAGGCFRVVNQNGRTSPLPSSGKGSGWDLEITLDISMISAACPHCHILVVEANQPSARGPGQGRGHRGPARCPGHFQQLRHP